MIDPNLIRTHKQTNICMKRELKISWKWYVNNVQQMQWKRWWLCEGVGKIWMRLIDGWILYCVLMWQLHFWEMRKCSLKLEGNRTLIAYIACLLQESMEYYRGGIRCLKTGCNLSLTNSFRLVSSIHCENVQLMKYHWEDCCGSRGLGLPRRDQC